MSSRHLVRSFIFIAVLTSWSFCTFALPEPVEHPFIYLRVESDVVQENLTGKRFTEALEQMKGHIKYLIPSALPVALATKATVFLFGHFNPVPLSLLEPSEKDIEKWLPKRLPDALHRGIATRLLQGVDFAPPLLKLSKGGVEGWFVFGRQPTPQFMRNLYLWKFFQTPRIVECPDEDGQYLVFQQVKGPGKSLGMMVLKGPKGDDGINSDEWLSVIESFTARPFDYDDLKKAAKQYVWYRIWNSKKP